MDTRRRFVLVLVLVLSHDAAVWGRRTQSPAKTQSWWPVGWQVAEKSSADWCMTDIALVVVGAAGAVVAFPYALGAAGVGAGGIAAGSLAAKAMSLAATAGGGGVAAGGVVATVQSIGAAGLGLVGKAVVGTAGAAVGKAVSNMVGACDSIDTECPEK